MEQVKPKRKRKPFFQRYADIITIFMVFFTLIAYPHIYNTWNAYKTNQFDKERIKRQWIFELYDVDNIIFNYTDYLNDIPKMSQEDLLKTAKVGSSYIKSRYYIVHKPTGKVYTNEPSFIGTDIESCLSREALFYYKVDATNPLPALKIDPGIVNKIDDLGDYEIYYWTTSESILDSQGDYVYMWQRRQNAIRQAVYSGIYLVLLIIYILQAKAMGLEELHEKLSESRWIKYILRFLKYIVHLLSCFGDLIRVHTVAFKVIAFIIGTPLVMECLANAIDFGGMFNYIVIGLYLFLLIPLILRDAVAINRIIDGTEKMAEGDLDVTIRESGSNEIREFARNINDIKEGFKISIDDKVKNERLKSELVANVSHDLKTPLTSIINYTDLLNRPDLTEAEKTEYVKILNNKSLRLKDLIEDLFEVSKMNSGKVKIEKENVDIVELINQSIGELSYIHDEKNIDFRVNAYKQPIILSLDGKKMARVFENLISNALKYSLPDTRVYVDVDPMEDGGVKICFKNISAYEMKFDVDEIFERFKRGDSSRNSKIEGSGLGLAIAKGIVELHGGRMYIEKEGDMFKAFIELKS